MTTHFFPPFAALAFTLAAGCGASVSSTAVHQPQTVVQNTVAVQPTPVQVSQEVHVHADGPSASGATSGAGAMIVGAPGGGCPGLTVHPAGFTRAGRALGMALVAVHARPGAELLVDGRLQGETPLTAVGVDAGPRDITLRNAPLSYECTVRLRAVPGERYAFQLDLDR